MAVWLLVAACGASTAQPVQPAAAAADARPGSSQPSTSPSSPSAPVITTPSQLSAETAAACAKIMPPLPLGAPREHDVPAVGGPVFGFSAGTSDGDGEYVALELGISFVNYVFLPAFGPDEPAGRLQAQVRVAPQPHGYHSFDNVVFTSPLLTVSNGKGEVVRTVPITSGGFATGGYELVADPGGGSVVLAYESGMQLKRFDEAGKVTGTAALDADTTTLTVGVASGGEALVLGKRLARWYDRDAQPQTEWFDIGIDVAGASVWALADGSIAIKSTGAAPADRKWVAVVRPASTAIQQPPAWLVSEIDPLVWVIRAGAAMAFGSREPYDVPYGQCRACGVLRIVTSDGTVCGTVELPGGADDVNIGRDGTVLTAKAAPASVLAWRWWPKLLQ